MKMIYLILLALSMVACEEKEYFPKTDTSRDSNLLGAWRLIDVSKKDSNLMVFSQDGYFDNTQFVSNNQLNGFTNLCGLWHNIKIATDDQIGKYYTASTTKHWTNGRWESVNYYKLVKSKDTLFIGTNINKLSSIYVKNDYQLIFDGPDYIGIDSSISE